MYPPSLEGSSNSLLVEDQLREIKNIFSLMTCNETASYMLKIGSSHWWDMTKRAYDTEDNPLQGTKFKELFLEKYFPLVKNNEKEAEFIRLTQGNLSLVEYQRKFDELSRYAPKMVNIEE